MQGSTCFNTELFKVENDYVPKSNLYFVKEKNHYFSFNFKREKAPGFEKRK